MIKKIALSVASLSLLLSPIIASADQISDLQAQIRSLIAQLQTLIQSQSASIPSTGANITAGNPAASLRCPVFWRYLRLNMTGDDVTALQQFLLDEGVFAGVAGGLFGPKTEAAVRVWQSQHGVVPSGEASSTGWGAVGPRTQAAIAQWCRRLIPPTTPVAIPSIQPTRSLFVAFPTAGDAPLPVTFRAYMRGDSHPTIQYGDGTSADMQTTGTGVCSSSGSCDPTLVLFSNSHTYASAGTYTAVVSRRCPSNTSCATTVGTVNIVVRNVVAPTTPPTTSNLPSIAVSVSPSTINQGSNLWILWSSIRAPANASVVLSLISVDGKSTGGYIATGKAASGNYFWTVPGPACNASGVCTSVTDNPNVWKTDAGQYRVRAQVYTPAGATLPGGMAIPSSDLVYVASSTSDVFTITGSSSTGTSTTSTTLGDLAITGLDRPYSLWVGGLGMWALHAALPGTSGQQVSYSVLWGDENLYGANTQPAGWQTSSSFSHAYSMAGTYSPRFTVTYNGQTISTTTVVTVGTQQQCNPDQPGCCGGMACYERTAPGSSCVTPWGSDYVASGGTIAYEPWFTNGVFSYAMTIPLMRCDLGIWLRCDSSGNNCVRF